ncbi:hypothetical protein [Chitinasiproducens palmae]|uniref:Uncharacterized protein n=1 Tax=Chitinasiproducens palmae TaxID=1770053 RepID=A0A1H2PX10_9BURK|nr:hypothetical protein [Chitinasiproducens palmae]SDV51514.1 hypothetical protein SAMN05216551_11820 [Chitinasiproducens palmae]
MFTRHMLPSRLVRNLSWLAALSRRALADLMPPHFAHGRPARLSAVAATAANSVRAAVGPGQSDLAERAHDATEVLMLPAGACRWIRTRRGDRLLVRAGVVCIAVSNGAVSELAHDAGVPAATCRVAAGQDWHADGPAWLRLANPGPRSADCRLVRAAGAGLARRCSRRHASRR